MVQLDDLLQIAECFDGIDPILRIYFLAFLCKEGQLSKHHVIFDLIQWKDVDQYLSEGEDIECFGLVELLSRELLLYEGDGEVVVGVEIALGRHY